MLEVRGVSSILGFHRPAVRQYLYFVRAGVDHRLDGQHPAFFQPRPGSGTAVIRDLRVFVHSLAHSVTAEFAHYRIAAVLDILLDGVRDIVKAIAWRHLLQRLEKGFPRRLEQFYNFRGDAADRNSDRSVADVAVQSRAAIDLDDVAVTQFAV